MMNTYEMDQEVKKAKDVIDAGEKATYDMADYLQGRLRQVTKRDGWRSQDILVTLKRELKTFNARTGEWK